MNIPNLPKAFVVITPGNSEPYGLFSAKQMIAYRLEDQPSQGKIVEKLWVTRPDILKNGQDWSSEPTIGRILYAYYVMGGFSSEDATRLAQSYVKELVKQIL